MGETMIKVHPITNWRDTILKEFVPELGRLTYDQAVSRMGSE